MWTCVSYGILKGEGSRWGRQLETSHYSLVFPTASQGSKGKFPLDPLSLAPDRLRGSQVGGLSRSSQKDPSIAWKAK